MQSASKRVAETRCVAVEAVDDGGWLRSGTTCLVFTSYPHPRSLHPKAVHRPTMSTDPDRERLFDNDELDSPAEPMFVPVALLSARDILQLTNIRPLAAQLGRYTL